MTNDNRNVNSLPDNSIAGEVLLRLGGISICRFDEESYWVVKDSGEGFQCKESDLIEMLDDFFQRMM